MVKKYELTIFEKFAKYFFIFGMFLMLFLFAKEKTLYEGISFLFFSVNVCAVTIIEEIRKP